MGKAKINFEIEEESLANAKAFVVKHGGSLNNLVSSLFDSLGQIERARGPATDPATRILREASAGKISIMEAASQLRLPDAGYVLQRLARENLPMPRLADSDLDGLASESLEALRDCLSSYFHPSADGPSRRRFNRSLRSVSTPARSRWRGCGKANAGGHLG